MTKLIYVQRPLYLSLIEAFKPSTPADERLIKVHTSTAARTAAFSGVTISQKDFDRLESGKSDQTQKPAAQPETDPQPAADAESDLANEPTPDAEAMTVAEAVAQLDPNDDSHWTKPGLPNIRSVEAILGADTNRDEINQAAPGFTRTVAIQAAA